MHAAEFAHKLESGRIECRLCPHRCKIGEGQTGLCKARGVVHGDLQALTYGILSSAHLDPIEKKPLYHFLPGSGIFSIGGWGCNFGCSFCQNWSISQEAHLESSREFRVEDVVRSAQSEGSIGLAYTYNEPLIAFEFVRDCARLARERGLRNVLVTNGYVESDPAAELLPLVDALNIDIKSMNDGFYRQQCRGSLAPVLAFAEQSVRAGCLVEITNLVIPGLNDRDEEVEELAVWVKEHLGPAVPLHLSAYRPEYKLDAPPTPPQALEHAFDLCSRHLPYVYMGNVASAKGCDTRCPACSALLVARRGYSVEVVGLGHGACVQCGRKADFAMPDR